jgi:predicted mannosyl-3-phosphoglycerate phosphatase (HAD superfamily)
MYDPSQGGADLITKDGNVVIEARMFQRTSTEVQPEVNGIIQVQLAQMVEKIRSDFKAYDSAQIGYVIFSYVDDSGMIHTIVLEVQK